MSDGPTPPRQTGCGVVALALPVFMAAGAGLGWWAGRPHGLAVAVLGGGAGFVLAVPACGLAVLAVAAPLAVVEWLGRGRSAADPGPPPEPPGDRPEADRR